MKLRLTSLQSRIMLLHLPAIVMAALAVPLANYLVINRSANQFEARTLRAHANTIAGYLRQEKDGSWRLKLPEDLRTLYVHGFDGLSYAITDAANRPLFASSPNDDATVTPAAGGLARISRNGAVIYGITQRRDLGRGAVRIKVAQNVQHPDVIFDDIVADYLSRIGWFTVAILALLLGIDIAIIRRSLRPVLRASKIASSIDPARLTLRLPTDTMPDELLPLIAAMNEALDRLEKGITLQREFTADAAHELRTPLAVLRARVDTFEDQTRMGPLKADLEIMSNIVAQLLDIADLEGAALASSSRVDLRAVCHAVASMLAEIAIRQDKALALTGSADPVWICGDATMVFRAIRNLVDNAIRHTPRGTTVDIEVTEMGSVVVKDCGPGVPEAERALIFRRFWRADRSSGEGAGLGLAIVSRIAEMHRAKIEVCNAPAGGAIFRLSFVPAASAHASSGSA